MIEGGWETSFDFMHSDIVMKTILNWVFVTNFVACFEKLQKSISSNLIHFFQYSLYASILNSLKKVYIRRLLLADFLIDFNFELKTGNLTSLRTIRAFHSGKIHSRNFFILKYCLISLNKMRANRQIPLKNICSDKKCSNHKNCVFDLETSVRWKKKCAPN